MNKQLQAIACCLVWLCLQGTVLGLEISASDLLWSSGSPSPNMTVELQNPNGDTDLLFAWTLGLELIPDSNATGIVEFATVSMSAENYVFQDRSAGLTPTPSLPANGIELIGDTDSLFAGVNVSTAKTLLSVSFSRSGDALGRFFIRAVPDDFNGSSWTTSGNLLDFETRAFDNVPFGNDPVSIATITIGELVRDGDYNGNGSLDAADIDLLSAAERENSDDLRFDANGDGAITNDDRLFWIADLAKTWVGDSNLDGEFNSSDFVFVFTAGEYEDALANNSTWATGDWNGDTDFNSSDFVVAFTEGGFEQGERVAVAAVPEPATLSLAIGAAAALSLTRRRRNALGEVGWDPWD